jgi:hypothetical protein
VYICEDSPSPLAEGIQNLLLVSECNILIRSKWSEYQSQGWPEQGECEAF